MTGSIYGLEILGSWCEGTDLGNQVNKPGSQQEALYRSQGTSEVWERKSWDSRAPDSASFPSFLALEPHSPSGATNDCGRLVFTPSPHSTPVAWSMYKQWLMLSWRRQTARVSSARGSLLSLVHVILSQLAAHHCDSLL